MEMVGGGRRSKTVHDADFLVTHDSRSVHGVIHPLVRLLVDRGRLVPQAEGFCRMTSDRWAPAAGKKTAR